MLVQVVVQKTQTPNKVESDLDFHFQCHTLNMKFQNVCGFPELISQNKRGQSGPHLC